MTMTFAGFVSVVSKGYGAARSLHAWATDAALKKDFEGYLSFLEKRRVLYAEWKCESSTAVLGSLVDIQRRTEDLRSAYSRDRELRSLLGGLITSIQRVSEVIRACNINSEEGEFVAFKALLRFRSDVALVLAKICGRLQIEPQSTELAHFIMNTALVRPRSRVTPLL